MLHPLLEDMFQQMNHAGICWCLPRWPSQPDKPSGDVDILVFRHHARPWRAVAERLGFVRLPAASGGKEWVYIAYHQPTSHWLRLHVVSELFFGPRQAMITDAAVSCLARRERRETVNILANEDMFWMTLLHCLLDKRTVAERHRKRLQQLLPSVEGHSALRDVLAAACPRGWDVGRVLECVQHDRWAALEPLGPQLLAGWRHRQPAGRRIVAFGRRLCHTAARIYYRLQRRGLSIALLGPDGAGKTTLADAIQRRFFMPVTLVYMGSGEAGRNRLLARWRVPGLGSPGRLVLLWWRFLASQWAKALGRLVIFDRYTYDAFLPQGARVPWPYRFTRWLHARACPAPDLVLILDAPGAVMYERKREQDPAGLESQRQHYLGMQQSLRRVQVVDASRPPETVQADVLARIWLIYANRWQHNLGRQEAVTT